MNHPLSDGQFGDLATELNTLNPDWGNESGFTVRPYRSAPQGPIERPQDRYLVGGVVPTTSVNSPTTGAVLKGFVQQHEAVLSTPEAYLGGWHEGNRAQQPKIDIDVASGHPRSVEGERAARTASIIRNERAYGEIDVAGGYVGTTINPYSTRVESTKEFAERISTAPGGREAVIAEMSGVGGSVMRSQVRWARSRAR